MELMYAFIKSLPLPRALKCLLLTPPGHFYSTIPSLREIEDRKEIIFGPPPAQLPAIDLNTEEQLRLFDQLKSYYPSLPFGEQPVEGLRYSYENSTYSYADAIVLYCMMRHLKPARIIEIGSGKSSCVMLDTNELFFGNSIRCTFIDPLPGAFQSMLKKGDAERIELLPRRVQDVDPGMFKVLRAGDILFIDSTHVSKIDSDVNHLFFTILPTLASGVFVHFHDILYPFEYIREWIYEGKCWNEAYMLRTFLQYNSAFKIVFFNTYLEHFYEERFKNEMPLCLKNRGGSIWLRKG